MANKDTSKQWFETGDYPTQAQFYQVWDWLRWKDEAIAIGDITGLQSILNSIATITAMKALFRDTITLATDGEWTAPAGVVVVGMVVKSTGATTIKCGLSAGTDEVFNMDIAAGETVPIALIHYSAVSEQLYFSGINGSTDIIILKNPA